MAGKTKTMHQVRMLLRQKLKGWSNRRIHRESGVSRITLRSYFSKLNSAGVSIEGALKLSDGKLAGLLWHFEATATEKEQPLKILYALFEYIKKELHRTGVTRLRLWEEYRKEEENGYGYSQFCEHYPKGMPLAQPMVTIEGSCSPCSS